MEREIAPARPAAPRVSELYHENSKQKRYDIEFGRRVYLLNNSPVFQRAMARTFKSYPGAPFIELPEIAPGEGPTFEQVAADRRSVRHFDGQPLTTLEMTRLLHFGAGITGRLDASNSGFVRPLRAAPSGGALYPIELYACVLAVEGLRAGLYHFAPDRRGLEQIRVGALADPLIEATWDREMIANAAVVFALAASFERGHVKYGERSYRFALLEAGHICQNMLLEAAALGLGGVAVGGFIDDEINELLDLDGVDEAAIYLMAAGRPASRRSRSRTSNEELVANLLRTLSLRGGPTA